MAIRKRVSKKVKNGYVYEVNFTYKINGISYRYWKGGFKTKKEAQEHENLKRMEFANDMNRVQNCNKTLKEVYDEFMEIGSTEFQYNTIYNTKKTLHYWYGKDATINLGNIPIRDIGYRTLQQFFNKRSDCGKACNEDIKTALRRIFVYAIRSEYISSNPIEYVKVTGVENKKEKHVLTYDEFRLILRELKNKNTFEYDAISMAVVIGFYTGLRISEVMALQKDDFDFEENTIYVHRKLNYKGKKKKDIEAVEQMKSKSSKALIPLPDSLKQELELWFEMNPYQNVICDEEGDFLDPDCTGNRIRSISNKLGIPFHFHLLRHTYTTYLVNAHVDVKVAQELLRHANFNTTMSVYAHVDDKKKQNIVNEVFCGENVAKVHKNKNTLS